MTPIERISKARERLLFSQGIFGLLSLKLIVKENPSIETMATDGTSLEFNPKFVDSLLQCELEAVVAHEVAHCMFGHFNRIHNREKNRANKAMDYAINGILIDYGFHLPKDVLVDSNYRGMAFEQIYNLLPPEEEDKKQSSNGQGNGKPTKQWNIGEVKEAKEGNSDSLEKEWRQSVSDCARIMEKKNQAQTGEIGRLVESINNPKVPWRELLLRFVDNNSKNDYSWSKPNRRFISSGLYLPSLQSFELGHIVLVIDMSGSIDSLMLNQFTDELFSILNGFPETKITVIQCDDRIREVKEYNNFNLPEKLNILPGGNTDFRPPFEHLEKEEINPTCLIYFTDGKCHRFPIEPSYPILWASTRKWNPPFGEYVSLID